MALIVNSVLGLMGAALVALLAQEYRYFRARRVHACDKQELFYPASAFHVVTLLKLSRDQELHQAAGRFVARTERSGGKTVYAGKVAATMLPSRQLADSNWDAFVLAQFPSREAYDAAESDPEYQKTRSAFASTYAIGMKRSARSTFLIPAFLLVRRVTDLLRRAPKRLPFRPAVIPEGAPKEMVERRDAVVASLLAEGEYGSKACLVLNVVKNGERAQREANAGYRNDMIGFFAEGGAGPLHLGKAIVLESAAEFDDVNLVYYPGVHFFAGMIQSEAYARVAGGKQPGDTLVAASVPLLPRL